jgi:cob(I)alamin adenosyltransferase
MNVNSSKKLAMTDSVKDKDHGFTRSGSGELLPKDDPLFEAIGALDELNGHIGLIISEIDMGDSKRTLSLIQKKLSSIMSELAYASRKNGETRQVLPAGKNIAEPKIKSSDTQTLRADIALFEEKIAYLKRESNKISGFIQPGKTTVGAYIHIARTVCRRAERRIVSMRNHYEISDEALAYINKLSEYLFYLSYAVNKIQNEG